MQLAQQEQAGQSYFQVAPIVMTGSLLPLTYTLSQGSNHGALIFARATGNTKTFEQALKALPALLKGE
jgi:hypothetical protein